MRYILFLLIFIQLSFAQSTKYGGSFLEIGVGARALSMGSANVAVADDGSAFYWNPAGLASLGRMQVSGMYADLFNSLENHIFTNVALPVFGGAMISASWIRLAVEDIPRYNDPHYEKYKDASDPTQARIREGELLKDSATDHFAYSDNAYVITIAKLNRLNADLGWQYFEFPVDVGYGVNFKMIDTYLDDKHASGLGIDAGIKIAIGLYDIFDDDRMGKVMFGINVQDLFNTKIKWDTNSKHRDEIERNWKYGFALSQPLEFMNSEMLIAYDLNSKYDGSSHLGLELKYKSLFALRLGSNSGNFTTGVGLAYWQVQINYAYQNHVLGNSHRVETSFYF